MNGRIIMKESKNALEHITELLVTKSTVKHHTYKNLVNYFDLFEAESSRLIGLLKKEREQHEEDLSLNVERKGENEIHLTIAGDTIVFIKHTNIITFSDDYHYNQTPYVNENPSRKFLGQINVYNFMADSIRYSRINDPGYLIARILINNEGRFFVEGEKPMSFLYGNISPEPLSQKTLQHLIFLMIQVAIEQDLVIPPFADIRVITLQQMDMFMHTMGGGHKVGFQMSYSDDKPKS